MLTGKNCFTKVSKGNTAWVFAIFLVNCTSRHVLSLNLAECNYTLQLLDLENQQANVVLLAARRFDTVFVCLCDQRVRSCSKMNLQYQVRIAPENYQRNRCKPFLTIVQLFPAGVHVRARSDPAAADVASGGTCAGDQGRLRQTVRVELRNDGRCGVQCASQSLSPREETSQELRVW